MIPVSPDEFAQYAEHCETHGNPPLSSPVNDLPLDQIYDLYADYYRSQGLPATAAAHRYAAAKVRGEQAAETQ